MKEMGMKGLVDHVRRLAQEYKLWSSQDCVIVAVSGGPDSVALLHVMHQLSGEMGLHLVCAHVNHRFRGSESDAEAEFVRQLATELSIPFELGEFNIPEYMKESGKGGQEAARVKRYQYLQTVAHKYGTTKVALAHHGDDQAETVMMRLLRGTGVSGLAGMKIKSQQKKMELLRPFVRIYKTDLVNACHMSGLTYVTDSSNALQKYTRNAVRLDVLPYLGQYNRQVTKSLHRLAEVVGEEDDYMDRVAIQVYEEMSTPRGNGRSFEIDTFEKLHVALQRRLIKLILNYLSVNTEEADFVKIEAIRQGALQDQPTTWSLDMGGGLCCLREYNVISFLPEKIGSIEYTYRVDRVPAEISIPYAGNRMQLSLVNIAHKSNVKEAHSKWEAFFDADELRYPLTVRSRLPGDVIRILGLNGSKKVKDIFIDEKIPPSIRPYIPIVTDASGQILWVCGVRRSAHATVVHNTSSIVHMSVEVEESQGGLSVITDVSLS